MKKHLLLSSTFALTALFCATTTNAQNNSLSLNGSTNYVTFGTSTLLDPNNIKTLECWVKFDDLTGSQEILSRSVAGSGIELLLFGGNLAFYCMNGLGATSYVTYPTSNLATNTWYHVAATWDGTKESMKIYLNGKVVSGPPVYNGDVNGGLSVPVGSFMIGQWSFVGENRFLKGMIDEVRVWSVNRSATQIKGGMYANFMGGATGLTAYYPFNESSGTAVNNMTTNLGLNGTIVGTVSKLESPIRYASNALNFDGSDDQIVIPANTAFDLTTGTIECWIRPTNLNTTDHPCVLGNRNTSTRFSFHIAANQIGMFNFTDGYKILNYTFNNNTWYHLAFVLTTANTLVYVNGLYIGAIDMKPNTAVTGQPLIIGMAKTAAGLNMEPFSGVIDDVRIWNAVRTATDIADNQNKPLTGAENGLVANYTFNAGIGAPVDGGAGTYNNNGLKIALDATSNNYHGTLTNFTLLGNTSNYVESAKVILPVELTSFAAVRKGMVSQLSWITAQEQNSKSFVVERSSNGVHFSAIATIAAARNSSTVSNYSFTDEKPLPSVNYYRLQQIDADAKSSYSKTVVVKFPEITVISVSPNPASTTLYYSISSLQATKVSVSILSAIGQRMESFNATVQAGSNTLSVDVSHLTTGNYTLQVLNTPAGVASSQPFSIVR